MNQMGWGCLAVALFDFAGLIYASKLDPVLVLFGCACLFFGARFAFRGFRRGLLGAQLLAEGKLAGGKLISKLDAGYEVQKRKVYDYAYAFAAADGSQHTVTARTTEDRRMEDDPLEPILYDVSHPSRAVVIDQLDGPPRIGADGQIQGASVVRAVVAAILPCIALVGVVVAAAAIVVVR